MKWIGQHIYDQISRFRNSVYLEDVSSGTIASGGNLGLDSNNKIVKAAEVGSSVDLTSEVTGTLPAGSGGTGVTSITALKNLLDDETWTFANNITGTLATAAQTNITSLGTLTALTVDDITLNTKSILITGDTDDTFNITTGAAGATTLTTTDNAGTDGHFEIAADGNITLDAAGDIAIEAAGDIHLEAIGNDVTVDTDNFTIESSTDTKPNVAIKSTTNSNKGSLLGFISDKGAAGADGDIIGVIDFTGDTDTQVQTTFGTITGSVNSADVNNPEGIISIAVRRPSTPGGSGMSSGLTLTGQPNSLVNALIGAGAASKTTVAGDLDVTTNLVLHSVNVTAVQTSGESFADNDTSLMTSGAINDRIESFGYTTNTGDITTVGTIGTGVWNATVIASAKMATASDSAQGAVELATTGEADTGTDTARAVTPAGLKSHVDARYAYQYINFSFDARNIIQDTWRSPGLYGITEVSWTNNHGAGQTQTASDAPSAVDIETTISVDYLDQATGFIIPKACKLDGFYGNVRVNGNDPNTIRPVVGFFRAPEPADSNTADVTATCVAFDSYDTTSGNIRNRFLKLENSGLDTDLAQGDILFPAVGFDATGNSSNGDINGAFTLVLKTLIT